LNDATSQGTKIPENANQNETKSAAKTRPLRCPSRENKSSHQPLLCLTVDAF